MPEYSSEYVPPAPTSKILLSTNIAEFTGLGNDVSIEVTMLMDTGADISFIPKSIIEDLENQLESELPYDQQLVLDFHKGQHTIKVYKLRLLSQDNEISYDEEFDFLEIDHNEGILGREILNRHAFFLDGPNLSWTYQR